jgi:RNA polymerase sigma factor (sigma-70 family)
VQDTLLKAWRAQGRVALADDPERYLLRIMMNCFRDEVRRGKRRVPLAEAGSSERLGAGVELGFAAVEDADWVGYALEHLNARQRAVVVLRYWADLDDQRIADVLGCRRSTVRSTAARALNRLRRVSEQEGRQP